MPALPAWLMLSSWSMVKLTACFPGKGILWLVLFLVISSFIGLIILLEKLASDGAFIMISANELKVLYLKSGVEIQLPFASIATYRLTPFRGSATLRFTCIDGSEQILRASYQLARFIDMAKCFEASFCRYKYGHDKLPIKSSIPTFFRGRQATILLIGLAVALGWITLLLGLPDFSDGKSFVLVMAYIGFAVYGLIWASAQSKDKN